MSSHEKKKLAKIDIEEDLFMLLHKTTDIKHQMRIELRPVIVYKSSLVISGLKWCVWWIYTNLIWHKVTNSEQNKKFEHVEEASLLFSN